MIRLGAAILFVLTISLSLRTNAQQKGAGEVPTRPTLELKGNTYCIISGISNYASIPSLDYADDDALAIRQFMQSPAGGNLDSSNILTFLNEEATAANIWIKGLSWIKKKELKSGDRLLVFLSGHGDAVSPQEYYYLAHDCDPGNDKDNYAIGGTIPLDRLKSRFQRLVSEGVTVIFILDACRTNELPGGQNGTNQFAQGIMDKKTGELALLSTGPGSVSIEHQDYGGGHGLFTYVLLNGLYGGADANNDGIINFREVEKYVKGKVEELADKKATLQIPEFCCPQHYGMSLFAIQPGALQAHLAANEERLKKSREENPQLMASKGLKGIRTKRDTSTVIGLHQSFYDALKDGKLRGKGSAEGYLVRLEEKQASAPLLEKARMDFSIALLDQSQRSINHALHGDPVIYKSIYPNHRLSIGLKNAWVEPDDSADGSHYLLSEWAMEKALEYLDEDFLPKNAKTKRLFLKVLQSERPDTSLAQSIRETMATDSNSAFLYQTLGILHAKNGDKEESLKYFTMAEERAPSSGVYKNNTGMMLWRMGRKAEATARFEAALNLDSSNESTRLLLSSIYYETGQLEKSSKVLNYKFRDLQALERAFFNYGVMKHNEKQHAEAREYYKKALTINPKNPLYFFNLALSYEQGKVYEQAEHYYKMSISVDPYYLSSYINLGGLYTEWGKYEEANKMLRMANAIDPNNYKTLNNLGMLYIEKNSLDLAEKLLLQSIDLAPDNYDERVIRNLVTLYYKKQMPGEATRWFRKLK